MPYLWCVALTETEGGVHSLLMTGWIRWLVDDDGGAADQESWWEVGGATWPWQRPAASPSKVLLSCISFGNLITGVQQADECGCEMSGRPQSMG
jgi:hypothetical protein